MKQLSGLDNLFLAMETGNQRMHVAGLGIYDPSTAPGGQVRFKSILKFFAGRLNQSTVFRRRLVTPPLGIDRPYWIDDPEIDLEYHIRHIALPHPGDWRQLCIQVARIHARPMDLSMPAWECYVIEGLDNIPGVPKGSFAMYTKFHHAALDGEGGAELIKAIHSLSPLDDSQSVSTALIADREPTAIEMYARAIGNRAGNILDTSRLLLDLGQASLNLGKSYLDSRREHHGHEPDDTPGLPARVPVTRFNTKVSAHRVVEALGLPLSEIQEIRNKVADVTVNDIFMAVTGGALRKYLQGKHELPATTLNAMVPISTRGAQKDVDAGNQVGMTAMPMRTDVEDALERLLAVRRGTHKGKQLTAAIGKDLPAKLLNLLPAAAGKLLINHGLLPRANITLSNVRGPSVPLYMAGAKLVLFMPVSIAMDHLGLNITGFSYNGILWVCAVACRQMMPDPAVFSQCYRDSFNELLQAARQLPDRAAAKPPRTAGKTASKTTGKAVATPASVKKPRAKPLKAAGQAPAKAASKTASKPQAKRPAPAKVAAAPAAPAVASGTAGETASAPAKRRPRKAATGA